jgi:hypothetical protein
MQIEIETKQIIKVRNEKKNKRLLMCDRDIHNRKVNKRIHKASKHDILKFAYTFLSVASSDSCFFFC